MKKRILLLALLFVLAFFMFSCVTIRSTTQSVSSLDRKLDMFTYIEEGDLVSFVVCTHATRYHEEDEYIPVEIAIANRGLRNLTVTRESFTLVDEQGNKYSMVPSKELLDNYEKLDFDRKLSHVLGVTLPRYETYLPVESNFEPERWSTRIVIDKVELPRFSFMTDMIYFNQPVTGLKGKKFELFLSAQELQEPVFVKFMVE